MMIRSPGEDCGASSNGVWYSSTGAGHMLSSP